MNPNVVEAIRKSAAVPSMPQVVTRFLEIIQDPDFDYRDVVKVLSVDAGTTAEILRLSNSALFGVSRKVTSLKQAVALLGPRRTRSMVMGRFLVESVGGSLEGGVDTSYFWRRSLVGAVVAARIADKCCPRLRDDVFLSALLADVGIPILAQAFPRAYAPLAARFTPYGQPVTADEEFAAVGVTHSKVSAMMLTEWGLPPHICEAVGASQDQDCPAGDESKQMARLINAADRIARLLCEVSSVPVAVETCVQAMDFVGVEVSVLAQLLCEVEKEASELASILHIDVIAGAAYQPIAKALQDHLCVPVAAAVAVA